MNRCDSVVWIFIQGGRSRKKHSPLGRLVEGEWRVGEEGQVALGFLKGEGFVSVGEGGMMGILDTIDEEWSKAIPACSACCGSTGRILRPDFGGLFP